MHIRNKRKFRTVRFILLKVSRLLKLVSLFRRAQKRILIVKIDAIGDYILFRNFLDALKNSEKYQNYDIELLGNKSWKDLALAYDKNFVSHFHFIDEDSLYEAPGRIFKIGWKLFSRKYEIVLQPTYSRTLVGNGLAAMAAGKTSIAYNSKHEHHPRYKKQTDRFYTTLIELPQGTYHEYERNHFFFKSVLDQVDLPFVSPTLPVVKNQSKDILIFPGSSYYKRNWEKEKFANIIAKLLKETDSKIVIAGGRDEVATASYFLGVLPSSPQLEDLTGKTSLPELIQLVSNSKLVISNETSAVHIAAACKTPVVCITGGGHFERFAPYAGSMSFKPICVYEYMPCYRCDWNCKYHNDFNEPFPCISRISEETVWNVITRALAKSNI